jgi:hypothetical protein
MPGFILDYLTNILLEQLTNIFKDHDSLGINAVMVQFMHQGLGWGKKLGGQSFILDKFKIAK